MSIFDVAEFTSKTNDNYMDDDEDYRHTYKYFFKYFPADYEGITEEMEKYRDLVLNFKKGIYDESIMKKFLYEIKRKIWYRETEFVVCFMPASNSRRHMQRYEKLYEYLKANLLCEVYLESIAFVTPQYPVHTAGRFFRSVRDIGISEDETFSKHVILIDDLFTTGRSFYMLADHLVRCGSLSVHGLFLAKTVKTDKKTSVRNS